MSGYRLKRLHLVRTVSLPRFFKFLPTLLRISEVVIVGYFKTDVPEVFAAPTTTEPANSTITIDSTEFKPRISANISTPPEEKVCSFAFQTQKIEISWTMKQPRDAPDISRGRFMQSVSYRGTLRLKYLAIPKTGADFFMLLLDDVNQRWFELVAKARLHLSEMVNLSLTQHYTHCY